MTVNPVAFNMIGVDLMGPYDVRSKKKKDVGRKKKVVSSGKKKYILTCTDYFTKWCDAFVIRGIRL